MYFTPIIPTALNGKLDNKILRSAEEIYIKSAKLVGTHNIHVINSLKDLLRITNSYYSNKIESEGTHPIDIDKAMKKDFSDDEKKRNLQILSLKHIETQKYIEENLNKFSDNYSSEVILDIHKNFYSKKGMEPFLNIKYRELEAKMVPGEFRKMNVAVGKHEAPDFMLIDTMLTQFQLLYKNSINLTKSEKLIYALCSHHRLVWIHPFLDGNGRISRLYLDFLLNAIGLEGYGLWNISRGLARADKEYKKCLSSADMITQGAMDGRGPLSKRGLEDFLVFMLEIAHDQIDFMSKYLKVDSLGEKIDKYVKFSQESMYDREPLPKGSELLFKQLLISGEVPRGKVKEIIDKKDRMASSLITKLLELDFIQSDTPRGNIRLKFNTHFASKIIPELFPEK